MNRNFGSGHCSMGANGQREWGRGSRFGANGQRKWGRVAWGRDIQTNEQFLREVIHSRPKLPLNDPRRMGCWHCGGDDHTVKNCPCSVTTYRGRPLPINPRCFNCHQLGHDASNCWKRHPRSFGAGPKRCWNCGDVGHYANYCQRPNYVGTIRN
ncbi:hypothetical protein ACQ4LE_002805 [Meloidogyne hapla]